MSAWLGTPTLKTAEQVAKENAFLSRVRLCEHNLRGRCNPPGNRQCNFAHSLSELQMPEERRGSWSQVWSRGDCDIRYWYEYHPNRESEARFRAQFMWERSINQKSIPNWAWGHAVVLNIILDCEVPPWVPRDYEWPKLQREWYARKHSGRSTALAATPSTQPLKRQGALMKQWEEERAKEAVAQQPRPPSTWFPKHRPKMDAAPDGSGANSPWLPREDLSSVPESSAHDGFGTSSSGQQHEDLSSVLESSAPDGTAAGSPGESGIPLPRLGLEIPSSWLGLAIDTGASLTGPQPEDLDQAPNPSQRKKIGRNKSVGPDPSAGPTGRRPEDPDQAPNLGLRGKKGSNKMSGG